MPLFENTYHSELVLMGKDWLNVWNRMAYLIARDAGRIYASEESAREYFFAMGVQAVPTCELSAAAIEFLRATASIVGLTAPADLPPPGFTLVEESSGRIVPIYVDPGTSSSDTSSSDTSGGTA